MTMVNSGLKALNSLRVTAEFNAFDPLLPKNDNDSFAPFYHQSKSLLLETKCVFRDQDSQMFVLKLNKFA